MNKKTLLIALLALSGVQAFSQNTPAEPTASKEIVSVFDRKKFFWGLTFNQTFSIIKGSQPYETYFRKPCIGGDIIAEYYPLSFVGLRVGVGYMQRGSGIKLQDFDNSLGNADSTYRTRLRMNALEFPIALVLRTPHDVIKGVRLAGGIGVIPYYNFQTNRIFDSVEDGFHDIKDQSKMYLKNDMPIQFFAGTHISVADYSMLQVELFFTRGTANVYKDASFGNANATVRSWGFRVTWVY